MKDEYLVYIQDVVEAMSRVRFFISGMDSQTFEQDIRTVYAVTRALEIIGEACKRVPEEIRDQYPAISWRAMAGMRDRLIHGYNNVNLTLVWETVNTHIPTLLPLFEQIIEEHRDPEEGDTDSAPESS